MIAASAFGIIGCSSDDEENPEPILTEPANGADLNQASTFRAIQTGVFDVSCANSACHAAPTLAGGLDLTAGVAYANLVNANPQNSIAAGMGMLRVQPNKPENSFLLTKLTQPKQGQGLRMPRGLGQLHPDKIEAIRKWIAAGAPQTGIVEGVIDLSNLSDPPPETFAPPPPPLNGVQLHLPPFEIQPGTEREIFYATRLPANEDIFVNKIEIFYPEGSHHFILYELINEQLLNIGGDPDGFRDLNPNSPAALGVFQRDRLFIVGTQTPETVYEFPEGVAFRFHAGAIYDMNSHFINLSGVDVIHGEAYVNLHTIPEDQVKHIAKPLFVSNNSIRIAPGETRTTRMTWLTRERINLFILTSHMHRHGDSFRITRLNGELLHESFAYNDPPTNIFNPPLVLEAGDGLTFECTHTNHDKNQVITFGLTSEDEMCIVLGYYF
jgi:hypothetical protein